ncbi:MAG: hypothetical protein AB4352_00250 [Hormoscilla sp.]
MFKLKKIGALIGQTALISLISLGLTEIAFRIYNKINPSFIFYDLSYNRFRGQPNAQDYDFTLNSKGFKDVEFNEEKATGTYRILGIGDSFAYGVVPYQYNYYTRVEEKLNQREKKFEIINMGIPNLGPKDYLSILVNEGLELNPDMAIVSFFIGNDFSDMQQTRSIYSYSYVASFIKFTFDLQKSYEGRQIHGNMVYEDDRPSMEAEKFLEIQTSRSYIHLKQNEYFENQLKSAVGYLRKIKEICDAQNIKLMVVIIPDELQVNEEWQSQVIQALNSNRANFDFTLPNRLLSRELESENIAYIDMLSEFKSVSRSQIVYKPQDSHWNIAGNELAAEMIYKYLSEKAEL